MRALSCLVAVSLLTIACAPAQRASTESAELTIATWNLEWFMTPGTLRELTPTCTPPDAERDGTRRSIPCDVAHRHRRSNEDIAAMRQHAAGMGADVIALQEVDGPEAARLVFPDYEFCFSRRVAVQNNGFAIRRGLPHACGADVEDLSLGEDVRRGVELALYPDTPREMRLLSVHLKSGCARDALDSQRPACGDLARQVPALERWIDRQAGLGRPFAVLGDFNRDLRREPPGPSVWADLDDHDPAGADLVNTAEGQTFENCLPSQTFSGFIDYVILDARMARGLVEGSFGRALYRPRDAARRKMSDHCPVFIRLRVADAVGATP